MVFRQLWAALSISKVLPCLSFHRAARGIRNYRKAARVLLFHRWRRWDPVRSSTFG